MTQQRRIQTARVSVRRTAGNGRAASDDGIPTRPADTSLAPSGSARPAAPPPTSEEAMQLEGVYIISVAARILDMHPQTLQKYERLGLVRPSRTLGMLRLYSTEDIRKLRLIRHLSDELGLNLAGVEFALAAVQNLHTFRQRLTARLGGKGGQPAEAVIDDELAQLLQSLNLPVEP